MNGVLAGGTKRLSINFLDSQRDGCEYSAFSIKERKQYQEMMPKWKVTKTSF